MCTRQRGGSIWRMPILLTQGAIMYRTDEENRKIYNEGCMFNKDPKGMAVSGCNCVPDWPRKLKMAISDIIQMAHKGII
jgi:hypothetical protein